MDDCKKPSTFGFLSRNSMLQYAQVRRWKSLHIKTKFQMKLFLCFAFLTTAIIGTFAIGLYKYLSDSIIDETQNSMVQLSEKTSEQIESTLRSMDSVATQVVCNPTIQTTFAGIAGAEHSDKNYFELSPTTKNEISDILLSINSPLLLVKRISIFNQYGDYINCGVLEDRSASGNAFASSDEVETLFSAFLQPLQFRLISIPHEDHWNARNQNPVVSIYRPVRLGLRREVYAIAEIQQPASLFSDTVSGLNNMDAYIFSSDGICIYAPAHVQDANVAQYEANTRTSTSSFMQMKNSETGTMELLACAKSSYTGWRVVLVQSKNVLMSRLRVMGSTLFLVGILLLCTIYIVIMLLSNHLTKPLLQLKDVLQSVNLTQMDMQLNVEDKDDEIAQVNTAFNEMLARLRTAVICENNAQFLALQAQMNPHFLYNTIAVISSAAQEANNQPIMDMCQILSSMLRYASSFDDSSVTLGNEIEYAQSYMKLMKIRYEDYLDYAFNIDPICLAFKTPKFLLQPLLENCFQHGLSCMEPPWQVCVTVSATQNGWSITVTDNGSGFTAGSIPAIIESAELLYLDLENNFNKTQIGSLGLRSVYARLRAVYQDRVTFTLSNASPHGAVITIGGEYI